MILSNKYNELIFFNGDFYEEKYSNLVKIKPSENNIMKSFRYEIQEKGNLDSLRCIREKSIDEIRIQDDELLIELKYVSLHFKDVLLSMGMLKNMNAELGMEASGKVILDNENKMNGKSVLVMMFNSDKNNSLMKKYAVIKRRDAIMCDNITPELTGYLGVMTTAYYCLIIKANISEKDTILFTCYGWCWSICNTNC